MTNIAAHVIKKLGGAQVVAGICGVDISRVHRWTYPKERGGTGGAIPAWHQVALLGFAIENGVDLTAADFFPQPEKGPEAEVTAAPLPADNTGIDPAAPMVRIQGILEQDKNLLPKKRSA